MTKDRIPELETDRGPFMTKKKNSPFNYGPKYLSNSNGRIGPMLDTILCVQEVVTDFIIVTYYIKWVTTSWTHSTINRKRRTVPLTKGRNIWVIVTAVLDRCLTQLDLGLDSAYGTGPELETDYGPFVKKRRTVPLTIGLNIWDKKQSNTNRIEMSV